MLRLIERSKAESLELDRILLRASRVVLRVSAGTFGASSGRPNSRAEGSQDSAALRCANASPETVTRAAKAPIIRADFNRIGAIWHNGGAPASADCLRPSVPLFCHPPA